MEPDPVLVAETPRSFGLLLFGPPNAGKTSLYNLLTGLRYKTVNYPGATVEYAEGKLRPSLGISARIVDTPGLVSLVPRSDDERVAVKSLERLPNSDSAPDLVLMVVDASQPCRHLVLVRQMLRAKVPLVVVLTMADIAVAAGHRLDPDLLAAELGVPVVAVNGRTGHGLADLQSVLKQELSSHGKVVPQLPDSLSEDQISADFDWADGVTEKCRSASTSAGKAPRAWDDLVLHGIGGPVLFVAVMSILFWCVFSAAAPLMNGIDNLVSWTTQLMEQGLPQVWWSALLTQGVVAGAGSVLVFVPQIAILFLAIGLLEDSGYLARGAVLVDRPLSLLGLNGKSFVPLLSGFACAIPAAMAARTIPGRRERILTLLVIPLMVCSARLPVFGLLLAFVFPPGQAWLAGLAMTCIYLASLVIASVVAAVGGRILNLPPSSTGFQIELPAWRRPVVKHVVVATWDRTISYLKRAGGTILAISVLFWLFMNFPSPQASIAIWVGQHLEPVFRPMGLDWRVGVALLAAFAAREVFVSALAVVFAVQGAGDSSQGLVQAMRHATFQGTNDPIFTLSSVCGLVVFFMVALQCLTTVAVMRKEAGSNRFALGQMLGFIVLAWVLSVAVVQGLRLLGVA